MNEEELNLDELDKIDTSEDAKLLVKNRYQQLANDKRTLSLEKEALEKAKAESDAKFQALEKESNFLKSFNQLSAKYPEANNFQDKILERVNQGLDPEEATLLVLAKEGKLQNQPVKTPSAEGGSASTNVADGDKTLDQYTTAEKLSALQEMEKSGELIQVLRQGINRS